MEEKKRRCILCGKMEVMLNYICSDCQERIQKEVIDKREEVKEEMMRGVKARHEKNQHEK